MFPLLSCALGALVKKILETKKDYETSTPSKFKVCPLQFQSRFPPLEGSVGPFFYVSHENAQKATWLPASVLTTVKCPVQRWSLPKEKYKQMEQKGAIV